MPSPLSRAALLPALALVTACSSIWPSARVARQAPPPTEVAASWPAPPPQAAAAPAPPAADHEQAPPRSLGDLVDRALRTDPTTRAVWQDARASAAEAGSRWALWYPSLDGTGALARARGDGPLSVNGDVASATVSLTWLLLDFGGRGALVDEGDRLLDAARLAEHAAVADLVLRVQETYFLYLGYRALTESERLTVQQAEANLAAAEGRRKAGLATVADVLQARTQLSQLRLALQQYEGQALSARGTLAVLAGLPPTAELEVGTLPDRVDAGAAEPRVEAVLAEAAGRNPELGQARALAEAADARARAASAARWPTLSFQGNGSYYHPVGPDGGADSTFWSAGLALRFPIFEGFGRTYDALAARSAAEAARLRADAAAQRVSLDVWTSFQSLRTAGRQLQSARALLESATASAEVTAGRYQEGVGSILDLLASQAALETARAEDVRARASWLISVARLARASGRLDLPTPAAPAPARGAEAP